MQDVLQPGIGVGVRSPGEKSLWQAGRDLPQSHTLGMMRDRAFALGGRRQDPSGFQNGVLEATTAI